MGDGPAGMAAQLLDHPGQGRRGLAPGRFAAPALKAAPYGFPLFGGADCSVPEPSAEVPIWRASPHRPVRHIPVRRRHPDHGGEKSEALSISINTAQLSMKMIIIRRSSVYAILQSHSQEAFDNGLERQCAVTARQQHENPIDRQINNSFAKQRRDLASNSLC